MADVKQPKGTRRPLGGTSAAKITMRSKPGSGPEITISQAPLGRSTLVDVADEMRASPWPRAPLVTVSYDDLPLDGRREKRAAAAPQRQSRVEIPKPAPARRPLTSAPEIEIHDEPQTVTRGRMSAPEIEIREVPMGRETLALIHGEADSQQESSQELPFRCDALELRTFVVPEDNLPLRSTDEERREFVGERLSHKLPCTMDEIRRIDLKQFEPGAVLVRVWCIID